MLSIPLLLSGTEGKIFMGHNLGLQVAARPGQKSNGMENSRDVLLVPGVEQDDSPTLIESISLSLDARRSQTYAGLFLSAGFQNLELTQIHLYRAKSGHSINKGHLPLHDEIAVLEDEVLNQRAVGENPVGLKPLSQIFDHGIQLRVVLMKKNKQETVFYDPFSAQIPRAYSLDQLRSVDLQFEIALSICPHFEAAFLELHVEPAVGTGTAIPVGHSPRNLAPGLRSAEPWGKDYTDEKKERNLAGWFRVES